MCVYKLPVTAGGFQPDQLMQVMMPVIDNEVCNQPGWYNNSLDESMVCAGFQEGERGNCDVSFRLMSGKRTIWICWNAVCRFASTS